MPFGRKKPKDTTTKVGPCLKKTGGQIDKVVLKLLQSGNDDSEEVRSEIFRSLHIIGNDQPILVLTQSVDYITSEKPPTSHQARILALMSDLVKQHCKSNLKEHLLDEELAKKVVHFAVIQATKKNTSKAVQEEGVKLVVTLTYQHSEAVLDIMIEQFPSGSLPNYYVMKALASISRENPIAFVPRLSELYSKVIPVLGLVKRPEYLSVFVLALGRWSEAILTFKDETEEEEQKEINFKSFQTNNANAFDVAFNNWKKPKEKQLKLAVAECIGLLTEVMDPKVFKKNHLNLISYFSELIKKENRANLLPLIKGLGRVLKCIYRDELFDTDREGLEIVVTNILNLILPLASIKANYNDIKSLKTQQELLSCFEYLCKSRLTQCLNYLLSKFQSKSANDRCGSLIILRHLVNRLDEELQGSRSLIISSCQVLISEVDYNVRKSFISLIMSMADQGYLTLEGGQNCILFLIKQCSITDKEITNYRSKNVKKSSKKKNKKNETPESPKMESKINIDDESDTSPQGIRKGADQILYIIASKVHTAHDVLWPYLFELIPHRQYTYSVGTICRVLSTMAKFKKEKQDKTFKIQFNKDVNLPRPYVILTRLFMLLNKPLIKKDYGVFICACCHHIGEVLHPKLGSLWRDNFKTLGKFLRENSEEVIKDKFSNRLLKLFKVSCENIRDDDVFLKGIGDTLVTEWKSITGQKDLEQTLLIYLGQVIAYSKHKSWITQRIQTMFDLAKPAIVEHQEGCGMGLGIAAAEHLDIVLLRCADIAKKSLVKVKSGFLGMGGKKAAPGSLEKKCLLVRAWGWIALKTPPKLMVSRLEAHVITHLLPMINESKEIILRESIILGVQRLTTAIGNSYEETKYKLKSRNVIIKGMVVYIISGNSGMKSKSIECISLLLKLKPYLPINDPLRSNIIQTVFKNLNIEAPHCKLNENDNSFLPTKLYDLKEANNKVMESIKKILITFIDTQPVVESLTQLIHELEFFVVSRSAMERLHALRIYKFVSKHFISLLRSNEYKQSEKTLKNLGHYLATIIPRVTDSIGDIRDVGLEVIQMLLFIDQLLRKPGHIKPSDNLRALNSLRKQLIQEKVSETRLELLSHLSEILCQLISSGEMKVLLINLIAGIGDRDKQSSLGTCRALQGIYSERGNETKEYLNTLLDKNIKELKLIKDENNIILIEQLKSINILTREHFIDVMSYLHNDKRYPLKREFVLIFKSLINDKTINEKLIKYELNIINNTPINNNGITPSICIATKALEIFFHNNNITELIKQYYFEFITTLLTRLGTALCKNRIGPSSKINRKTSSSDKDNKKKKDKKKKNKKEETKEDESNDLFNDGNAPVNDTVNGLKKLLETANELLLLTELKESNVWNLLHRKNYEIGLCLFISKFCIVHDDQRHSLFENILPFFKKHYVGQRNSSTVVTGELIKYSKNDIEFLNDLISQLLPRCADKDKRIRVQALIGLGNLGLVWSEELEEQASSILSSLSSAIEDQQISAAVSALNSLTSVLNVLSPRTVQPSLINICFKLRSFYDSSEDDMRNGAFKLFGVLTKYGTDNYAQNFHDQIHIILTKIICHCNDINKKVSDNCYNTFKLIANYIEINELIEILNNESNKTNYLSLISGITPILINNYFDQLTSYLHECINYMTSSRWGEIKGNAALFASKLIQNIPIDKRNIIDIDAVVKALIKLLQHNSPRVKQRCAKALSFLSKV